MKAKKLIIIGIIFIMVGPIISYAITLPTNNSFLTINKKEVSKKEKVVLSLNLDQIQYDEFEFTLTSSADLSNIAIDTENIEKTSNSNNFKMIVNKSDFNISNLDLYYQIPENIEIGNTITFKAIVKEYDSESEEENNQETTISVTIVEETENKQEDNKPEDNQIKYLQQNGDQKSGNNNMESKSQNVTKTQVTSSKAESSIQETNTYNGESNNYLSQLEIANFNINPNFSKTNLIYFLEVENTVTNIEIDATAEDSNATISIYGNENLKQGKNKVLINLTAENGSVKTYKLYVTRK